MVAISARVFPNNLVPDVGKDSPERFGRCGGLGGGWVGNLNFARKLPSAPCPILPD